MALALFLTSPSNSTASTRWFLCFVESSSILDQLNEKQIGLLEKLNRADRVHLRRLGKLIVPDYWDLDELEYSPMPASVKRMEPDAKVMVIHLPWQVFGAYEHGHLTRWGPVSSGRALHPTPAGLFFLNWKSRQRTSKDNSNWHLRWYFNFHNQRGLAFHEFSLPGRPASHACIRLLQRDAEWLFWWGEGWTLSSDGRKISRHGTSVVLIGEYDFSSPRPWLDPESWKARIALPEDVLDAKGG